MAQGAIRNYNGTKLNSIWDIEEIDDSEPHIYYSRTDIRREITPVKSFKECNLNGGIIERLRQLDVVYPYKVQQYALPLLIHQMGKEAEDVLICAKDYGKTIAAMVSLLQILSGSSQKYAKALIICPKQDIAEQTFNLGSKIAKLTKISLKLEIRSKANKNKNISEQIIVGTPKRLENIIQLKLLDVENISVIVIDDAHLIFGNKGHEHSLLQIFFQVPHTCHLVFMCSAPPKEISLSYESLITPLKNKRFHPLIMEFPMSEVKVNSNVTPKFIECNDVTKKELLCNIIIQRYQIATRDQIIIICQERDTILDLYDYLEDKFESLSFVTAKLRLDQMESIIAQFNNRKIKILIITPSVEISKSDSLTTVINFDHAITREKSSIVLDMMFYNKWINIIPNRKDSLYINFVHEKYAEYVFNEIPREWVLDKNRLIQLCSHGRS